MSFDKLMNAKNKKDFITYFLDILESNPNKPFTDEEIDRLRKHSLLNSLDTMVSILDSLSNKEASNLCLLIEPTLRENLTLDNSSEFYLIKILTLDTLKKSKKIEIISALSEQILDDVTEKKHLTTLLEKINATLENPDEKDKVTQAICQTSPKTLQTLISLDALTLFSEILSTEKWLNLFGSINLDQGEWFTESETFKPEMQTLIVSFFKITPQLSEKDSFNKKIELFLKYINSLTLAAKDFFAMPEENRTLTYDKYTDTLVTYLSDVKEKNEYGVSPVSPEKNKEKKKEAKLLEIFAHIPKEKIGPFFRKIKNILPSSLKDYSKENFYSVLNYLEDEDDKKSFLKLYKEEKSTISKYIDTQAQLKQIMPLITEEFFPYNLDLYDSSKRECKSSICLESTKNFIDYHLRRLKLIKNLDEYIKTRAEAKKKPEERYKPSGDKAESRYHEASKLRDLLVNIEYIAVDAIKYSPTSKDLRQYFNSALDLQNQYIPKKTNIFNFLGL